MYQQKFGLKYYGVKVSDGQIVPIGTFASLLDNHHYNKYTHFGVELENWNYSPSKGQEFSKERTLCRKHLQSLETKIASRNQRRKVNSLQCRVITVFPKGKCHICGSVPESAFSNLPEE